MSTKEVRDLMRLEDTFPVLQETGSLKEALDLMTLHSIGMICIVNTESELVGVLSDGDLRRLILSRQNPLPALLISDALDFGTKHPVTCYPGTRLDDAVSLMKSKKIWDLPVIDEEGTLVGLLHLHDI